MCERVCACVCMRVRRTHTHTHTHTHTLHSTLTHRLLKSEIEALFLNREGLGNDTPPEYEAFMDHLDDIELLQGSTDAFFAMLRAWLSGFLQKVASIQPTMSKFLTADEVTKALGSIPFVLQPGRQRKQPQAKKAQV